MDAPIIQLSVTKSGGETFIFRCPEDQISALIAEWTKLADDPQRDFDWFDAAIMSFVLGRRLGQNGPAVVADQSSSARSY